MNDDSYPNLCTDVPPPSEKSREKSLFSRFFSEGGGDVCTQAILSDITAASYSLWIPKSLAYLIWELHFPSMKKRGRLVSIERVALCLFVVTGELEVTLWQL